MAQPREGARRPRRGIIAGSGIGWEDRLFPCIVLAPVPFSSLPEHSGSSAATRDNGGAYRRLSRIAVRGGALLGRDSRTAVRYILALGALAGTATWTGPDRARHLRQPQLASRELSRTEDEIRGHVVSAVADHCKEERDPRIKRRRKIAGRAVNQQGLLR
jgi:hypothetical protein